MINKYFNIKNQIVYSIILLGLFYIIQAGNFNIKLGIQYALIIFIISAIVILFRKVFIWYVNFLLNKLKLRNTDEYKKYNYLRKSSIVIIKKIFSWILTFVIIIGIICSLILIIKFINGKILGDQLYLCLLIVYFLCLFKSEIIQLIEQMYAYM